MAYLWLENILTPLLNRRIEEIRGLENLPKGGAYIIVSNHNSFLDPPLIVAAVYPQIKRKVYFLVKKEIAQFFKKFFLSERLGIIPIDPKNKNQCLENAFNYLKKGEICVIFPEGTRNAQKELLKGKTGAARLSLWAKTPVVPIGYQGPATKNFFEAIKNFLSFSKKIKINIGKPLYFDKYYNQEISKELLDKITKEIMSEISKLCHKSYLY